MALRDLRERSEVVLYEIFVIRELLAANDKDLAYDLLHVGPEALYH